MYLLISIFLNSFLVQVLAEKATGVFIPSVDTYLLSTPFQGYVAYNANTSTNFVNTVTANATTNAVLAAAKNATYYAFDQQFYEILGGQTPEIELLQMRESLFAYEAGAWDYDRNQVWFTSSVFEQPTYISVLDLKTNNITTLNIPALDSINPNGGYYFDGQMYFTTAGNKSEPIGAPGIYAIDTTTYQATPIVNNFFGLQFQSVDDLSWVKAGNRSCIGMGPNLFFSTLNIASFGVPGLAPVMLQDGVYRFSPQSQSVQGVISRADIVNPNGVRTDATGQYLYVTGTTAPFSTTGAVNTLNTSVIYRFTLDEDCFPINKRLVATVRSYADGLHIDDYGRIWTGEYDGITVRSPNGKVLGVFNAEVLGGGGKLPPIANFALAGDKLVILALDRLYVLQLGQNVTSAATGTQ